jgi:hypothetical protein
VPHFSTEFWVSTGIGLLLALLGFGVGVGMDAKSRGEYAFVVSCFFLSALMLIGMVGLWAANTGARLLIRSSVAVVICGSIILGAFMAIRWAQERHEEANAKPAEPQLPTPPTPEQSGALVGENIKKWLTKIGLPFKEVPVEFAPPLGKSPFGFEIRLPNGMPLSTYVQPDFPDVLHMRINMLLTPEQLKIWNSLNSSEAEKVKDEIGFELNKQHIYAAYREPPTAPGAMRQQVMELINPMPFKDLTEFTFNKGLMDMTRDSGMAYRIRDSALRHHATQQR